MLFLHVFHVFQASLSRSAANNSPKTNSFIIDSQISGCQNHVLHTCSRPQAARLTILTISEDVVGFSDFWDLPNAKLYSFLLAPKSILGLAFRGLVFWGVRFSLVLEASISASCLALL